MTSLCCARCDALLRGETNNRQRQNSAVSCDHAPHASVLHAGPTKLASLHLAIHIVELAVLARLVPLLLSENNIEEEVQVRGQVT